ncbi:PREDICTED: uncharacterized protein LOC104803278 isoform X3 [Tarenaya hassleriana]|uniref:uncharacterized protein LOC104803278 isoform X3 n=1 Tax=Tarenaya hassleriana TaxID=28532 RepID=UPI00053C212E|nr:PREDICTED: uncharacterized protein LOC104803278 isoform X3 [Tarenaya hassleriana]
MKVREAMHPQWYFQLRKLSYCQSHIDDIRWKKPCLWQIISKALPHLAFSLYYQVKGPIYCILSGSFGYSFMAAHRKYYCILPGSLGALRLVHMVLFVIKKI